MMIVTEFMEEGSLDQFLKVGIVKRILWFACWLSFFI